MSFANLAAEIFMKQIGGSGDIGDITSAFTSLLGGSDGISTDQITNILGGANISDFASKIGIEPDVALSGLKNTIPDMIDQSSSGGSLLDSIGGIGGALNIAKGFF